MTMRSYGDGIRGRMIDLNYNFWDASELIEPRHALQKGTLDHRRFGYDQA